MNKFIAKKLGEVLAFTEVGDETFERGQDALMKVFDTDNLLKITRENLAHGEEIKTLTEAAGESDITLKKSEGTGEKLKTMRDLYIGDEWDNPIELMEWSGFFEGAALVHWNLILGITEGIPTEATIDKEGLRKLAEKAIDFHRSLLEKANHYLHDTGKIKAQE